MSTKRKVKIYTLTGLSEVLGSSYGYIRQVLMRYQRGEVQEHRGFRFFGQPNKAWYAYKADDFDIEIIDRPELLPGKERESERNKQEQSDVETSSTEPESKP